MKYSYFITLDGHLLVMENKLEKAIWTEREALVAGVFFLKILLILLAIFIIFIAYRLFGVSYK